MININILLIYFVIIFVYFVFGSKYMPTQELAKCKEYDATSGYSYTDFFKVEHVGNPLKEDELVNINVAILAAKDAHILLSSTENPTITDLVYEIVLGAGSNSFSEIRRVKRLNPMTTTVTKKLLSAIEALPITIKQNKTGYLEIRIQNESVPLMSIQDAIPTPINYISFGSWGQTEARFYYGCANDSSDILEILTRHMKPREQLDFKLFSGYNAAAKPENLNTIEFALNIQRISFDTKHSVLSTRGKLFMKWQDERLVWNPENFSDIFDYRSTIINVWNPNIMLINAQEVLLSKETRNARLSMSVIHNGTVQIETSSTNFQTWCTEANDVHSWPQDEVVCELKFGTYDTASMKLQRFSSINIREEQLDEIDWHMVSMEIIDQSQSPTRKTVDYNNLFVNTDLIYRIHLRRNENYYRSSFITPFLTAIWLMGLSIWTEGYTRIFLSLFSISILLITLMSMVKFLPTTYVPVLVTHYKGGISLAMISILLIVCQQWLVKHPPRPNKMPYMWILQIISNSWFRLTFLLGPATSSYSDIRESNNAPEKPWSDISKIFDRFYFFIVLLFSIYVSIKGY